jgi:uncharacterized membrane protein
MTLPVGTAGTETVAGAPARVRGWRRGVVRLAASAAAGVLTATSLSKCGVAGLHHVAGWDVGSIVFAGLGWLRIMTMDAANTRQRAAAEDPGRTMVWVLVLAASAFSLFATLAVLRNARIAGVGTRGIVVALCLLAMAMAWILTHTSYALRYAHLYYRDDDEGIGGLEFPNQAAPCYFDFAYFSFTVGMCFQVSDVVVSSPQIRRAVLGQAILAFIYNTTIMALSLNLVFSLLN